MKYKKSKSKEKRFLCGISNIETKTILNFYENVPPIKELVMDLLHQAHPQGDSIQAAELAEALEAVLSEKPQELSGVGEELYNQLIPQALNGANFKEAATSILFLSGGLV